MTITGTLANLICMHEWQLPCCIPIDHITDGLQGTSVGKIDLYASVNKTTHWTCSYTTNNYRLGTCSLEHVYRDHAAASLVVAISNSLDLADTAVFSKFNKGKDITMTEMFGAFRLETSWIIRWDCNSHYHNSFKK